MVVWAIADRFLDIVGGIAILLWTIKACKWYWRDRHAKPAGGSSNLNRGGRL